MAHRSIGFYYRGYAEFVILFLFQFLYDFLPVKAFVSQNMHEVAFISSVIFLPLVVLAVYVPVFKALREKSLFSAKKKVLLCCIAVYLISVMVSRLLVDAFIPPSFRIFSPVVILILLLWAMSEEQIRKSKKWVIVYVFVVFLDGGITAIINGQRGWGYTNKRWEKSILIRYSRNTIPDSMVVYTNVPEFFYLYDPEKKIRLLPFKYNPWNQKRVNSWQDSVVNIAKRVKSGKASIVYFRGFYRHSVNDTDIEKVGMIKPSVKCKDGAIFFERRVP